MREREKHCIDANSFLFIRKKSFLRTSRFLSFLSKHQETTNDNYTPERKKRYVKIAIQRKHSFFGRRRNGIYWKDQKDDLDGVTIPTPYLQQFLHTRTHIRTHTRWANHDLHFG